MIALKYLRPIIPRPYFRHHAFLTNFRCWLSRVMYLNGLLIGFQICMFKHAIPKSGPWQEGRYNSTTMPHLSNTYAGSSMPRCRYNADRWCGYHTACLLRALGPTNSYTTNNARKHWRYHHTLPLFSKICRRLPLPPLFDFLPHCETHFHRD